MIFCNLYLPYTGERNEFRVEIELFKLKSRRVEGQSYYVDG